MNATLVDIAMMIIINYLYILVAQKLLFNRILLIIKQWVSSELEDI
jgi:hypothetical protein